MKIPYLLLAFFAAAVSGSSSSRDVGRTYELIEKGRALTAAQAADLEKRLEKKAQDEEARIELLEYYAARASESDPEKVKTARAGHILWLIEHDPKEGFGLFQVSTGSYRINCQGDNLADIGTFQRVADAWMAQMKRYPADADIRRKAVDAIQYCHPDAAERILVSANDLAGLGRVYAAAVLGITGQSYLNSDPAGTDSAFRERPFAAKARKLLEEATDRDLTVAAAKALFGDGGILWADGKLDWDYTALGLPLLDRALRLAPDDFALRTLPVRLPERGERPPAMLRVGGNVMAKRVVRQVDPVYPPRARDLGIEGKVALTVLIGLDGKIVDLRATAGPAELIPASVEAVRQWEYKPTLLNGKPCYIQTQIDVNFTLRP